MAEVEGSKDLISVLWSGADILRSKMDANEYKDYICNQVLGTSLTLTDGVESGTELEFDDFKLYVSVVKE